MQIYSFFAALLLFLVIGCTAPIAEPFSSFDDIRGKVQSADQVALLKMAEADFQRVDSHHEPKFAGLKYSLRDGGTKYYEGQGYTLIAHGKIEKRGDTYGQMRGATLRLEKKITGGSSQRISTERFVARN